ncbi:MAG: DUF4347 domain-containing protein [Pirellulaceae bacterium]
MSNRMNQWWQQIRLTVDKGIACAQGTTGSHGACQTRTELDELEPRILFSATPIDLSAVMGDGDAGAMVAPLVTTEKSEQSELDSSTSQQAQSQHEIIIIDGAVPDLQQLLDDLSDSDRDGDVYVLDQDTDGVQQISEILESYDDVTSVHLVSHAENGAIKLGSTWLSDGNLDGYAGQIAMWQDSLTADADILIYGCDLASSENGRSLIESIETLSGADVAASDDDTGHADYNGDWDLEYTTGVVETQVAFSSELQASWQGKLATITVTTFADENNFTGLVSLREAISDASNGDTIDLTFLGAGTFTIDIDTLGISKDLTIAGIDADSTVIDATGLGKRVFHLQSASVVNMSGITIQGGAENNGGGIFVDGTSTLNLSNALLQDNTSNDGGAIHVHGTAHLNSVLLYNNTASGKGGGINFHGADGGSLTNVTISGNSSGNDGGGIFTDTSITIINSTITLNDAGKFGGGIKNNGGTVNISNTIVAANTAGNTFNDVSGTFVSNGFNLIEDVSGGSGFGSDITGVSANFGALADNGGQTDTHALLAGSAAIDAGTNLNAPAADARGFMSGDGLADIGAFQVNGVLHQKVYWTDNTGNKIFRSDLDGSNVEEVLTSADGVSNPTELVVDATSGKFYWTEFSGGKIKRANLDGTGIETLYSGLSSTVGLAIDSGNNMLYWTENPLFGGTNKIRRADMDGGGAIEDLPISGLLGPSHLELDLAAGKLYWTDDSAGTIRRADLDGNNIENLVSGLNTPRGIKLDLANRMMYWTENPPFGGTNKVARANLDGTIVVEDLITSGLQDPGGIEIDIANGMMYFSDHGTDKILRVDLDNPTVAIDMVTTGLSLPYGIALGPDGVASSVAPTITSGGILSYTEGDGQVFLHSGITVVDADGTLEGATISITTNHTPTEDGLLFTNQNGIVGNYVSSTGVLTLTGSATVAQYEAALHSIKYENTSINPNSNTRVVTFQVNDGTSSANSTRMISVANVGALAVDTTSDLNDGADTSSISALMDNKGADGKVSLREAIEAANNTLGVDTIHFQIDDPLVNGAHTILVGSGGLDAIIEGVIIDATTDDSYGTTPVIELNGTSAGTAGLIISGNNVTIRGLIINRFSGPGIQITGDNNNIQSSYIGLNVAGDTDLGNAQQGIQIIGGVGNVIGGSGVGNVISGNGGAGIAIIGGTASNNSIQGNLIGTDATGTFAIGNDEYGIEIGSGGPDNNTIGGTTAGLRNVISGNSWSGVYIGGAGATGNLIQGNYIGTDIDGGTDIGNLHDGVHIDGGASGNTIDGNLISGNTDDGVHIDGNTTSGNLIYSNFIGTNADVDGAIGNGSEGVFVSNASGTVIGTAGAGNVIGGNFKNGIKIAGSGAMGTFVQGNFIGTDSTETYDLGNATNGIRIGNKDDDMNVIGDPSSGKIGGDLAGQANVIANQTEVGVKVTAGAGFTIQQNSIYDNGGDGIELNSANADRVAPMIGQVLTDGASSITITGTYLDASVGVDTLKIEYFSNPGDVQQGKTFLGSETFTTIADGSGTISHTISANVAVGEFITATVTDSAGNTSEFSVAVAAVTPSTPVNVTARETIDSDADGQIDYIKITTDANLNDDFSGLTISVAGYGLDGTTPYVTSIGSGGANDNVFYVMLQESGTPDTGATPIVDISANSSLDLLGGGGSLAIDSSGIAATDKAGAVLVAAISPDVLGTTIFQANGHQLDFVFSESLTGLPSEADLEAALLFAAGASDADNLPSIGTGVDPIVLATTLQTNDTIRVTLNTNNTISADGLLVGTHTVEITDGTNLTDAAGNVANNSAAAVIVGELNDEPTLSATADNPTFTENDVAPSLLFSGANASTIESGQTFTALTLTITNVSDGSDEILGADGSSIAMIDGTGSFTANNGLSYSVSISGGTATVAFTGGTLSATELETIINTLTYQNTSENPNTSDRVVTLTSLTDSGGTIGGGDDTVEPGISSTITVDAQNDAPTLAGGSYVLTGTDEDNTSIGTQAATILAGLTNGDVDGDTLGLAITAVGGNGTWQYSTNSTDGSDGSWTDFGAVASNSAQLLSNTSWVRYQPDTVSGETATLTFHAWDGTNGVASVAGTPSTGDPAGGGGMTAYSNVTAQASLTVSDLNDAPTGINLDNASISENVSGDIVGNISVDDADVGDTHTWQVSDSRFEVVGGKLRLQAGVSLDAEAEPVVHLDVTVTDQAGLDYTETFVITVDNVNESPTATNDSFEATAGSSLTNAGSVLVNDTDPDSDPTTVTLAVTTANGRLTLNADGTFTYTPDSGFVGIDTFQYEISDGTLTSNIATVSIDVRVFAAARNANDDSGGSKEARVEEKSTEENVDETEVAEVVIVGDTTSGAGETVEAPKDRDPNPLGVELVDGIIVGTDLSVARTSFLAELTTTGDAPADADSDRTSHTQAVESELRTDRSRSEIHLSNIDYVLLTSPGQMWNELDQQRSHVESQIQGDLILVGATGIAASGFTVGIAAWAMRTGVLAYGLLLKVPAWKAFDPLLVMQGLGENGDEESLKEMMNRRIETLDNEEGNA